MSAHYLQLTGVATAENGVSVPEGEAKKNGAKNGLMETGAGEPGELHSGFTRDL